MNKSQKQKDFEMVVGVIQEQMDKDYLAYNSRMLTELAETYLQDIQDTSRPVLRDVENWAKHTTLLEETSLQYYEDSLEKFPKTSALQVLTHNFLKDSLKNKDLCKEFENEVDNYPSVSVATMGLLNSEKLNDYMDKNNINATQLFNDNIKQIKKSVDALTKSLNDWCETAYPNCFAMAKNVPYDKKECISELVSYQYLETMTDYLSKKGMDNPLPYKDEWKIVIKQIEKELPNEFKKSVTRKKNISNTKNIENER